jgi:hypothetical protein
MAKPVNPLPPRLGAMTALAVSVILAGCNSFPFQMGGTPAPQPAAAASSLPPPPPHKPATPASPAVVRVPEAPEPEPSSGFDRLIGLDQPQLTAVLGEPAKRADAPPATIWRYVGQACELEVYFYFDLQSQAMRALHYEVRSHESREQPAQQCYDELVRERRAGAEPAAGTDRPR